MSERLGKDEMKKVATTVRCVPRYGYENTQVRVVELEMPEGDDERVLRAVLVRWFAQIGIADAVFDIDVDDDGFFAVINDDAFAHNWGEPVL